MIERIRLAEWFIARECPALMECPARRRLIADIALELFTPPRWKRATWE